MINCEENFEIQINMLIPDFVLIIGYNDSESFLNSESESMLSFLVRILFILIMKVFHQFLIKLFVAILLAKEYIGLILDLRYSPTQKIH